MPTYVEIHTECGEGREASIVIMDKNNGEILENFTLQDGTTLDPCIQSDNVIVIREQDKI